MESRHKSISHHTVLCFLCCLASPLPRWTIPFRSTIFHSPNYWCPGEKMVCKRYNIQDLQNNLMNQNRRCGFNDKKEISDYLAYPTKNITIWLQCNSVGVIFHTALHMRCLGSYTVTHVVKVLSHPSGGKETVFLLTTIQAVKVTFLTSRQVMKILFTHIPM